ALPGGRCGHEDQTERQACCERGAAMRCHHAPPVGSPVVDFTRMPGREHVDALAESRTVPVPHRPGISATKAPTAQFLPVDPGKNCTVGASGSGRTGRGVRLSARRARQRVEKAASKAASDGSKDSL